MKQREKTEHSTTKMTVSILQLKNMRAFEFKGEELCGYQFDEERKSKKVLVFLLNKKSDSPWGFFLQF